LNRDTGTTINEIDMRKLFGLHLLDNHFPALHGMRVIAIISVLQIHVTIVLRRGNLIPPTNMTALSRNIFFGMDLFFILSGFLIGSILLYNYENRTGAKGVARFYARRLFRTVPLYWFTLILLMIIPPLIFPALAGREVAAWRDFLYITNYGHNIQQTSIAFWGWSLCVEEHFYLAVPAVMLALMKISSSRGRLATLVGAWLAAFGLRMWIFFSHEGFWTKQDLFEQMYIPTHARLDILIAGIFLAYVQRYHGATVKRWIERRRVRAAGYAISLLCLMVLLYPRFFGRDLEPFLRVLGWGTITSIMYVPLVLIMINGRDLTHRFLGLPLFRRIGTLGYGIYLVHIPVCIPLVPLARWAIFDLHLSTTLVWAVILTLLVLGSIAVSYVLHLIVERPMLALRDKVAPSDRK
jgi:peptidoglycan/LPS O-acetylase OafA/YrhL